MQEHEFLPYYTLLVLAVFAYLEAGRLWYCRLVKHAMKTDSGLAYELQQLRTVRSIATMVVLLLTWPVWGWAARFVSMIARRLSATRNAAGVPDEGHPKTEEQQNETA